MSFIFALQRRLSAFCKIRTSDWVDYVIQSTAPSVIIKCKENKHNRGFPQSISCVEFNDFFSVILHKTFLCCSV